MAYSINRADGSPLANVADDVQLSNVSSLVLFGRGTLDYGSALNNDLILLLQNFATASAPSYPLTGQLWYDTSGQIGVLKLFDTNSNWQPVAQIGGFGDTELVSGGTTLGGAVGAANRISGSTGFIIANAGKSTNATLFLSEGLIIAAVCAENLPSAVLPAQATIRGYNFPLAARFPNGFRAGFTLAINPGGPLYTGLGGGGDGSDISGLAATVQTQNDDLLQLLTVLQKTVGDNSASISDLQTVRVTDSSAFAQEIKTLQASVAGALATASQTTTVGADQLSALSQQITSLSAQFQDNKSTVNNELTAYANTNSSYAQQISALTSQVGAAQSSVTSLQKSQADANSALAQQIQTLSAGLTTTSPDGQTILNLAAQLQTEQAARVSGDAAVSQSVTNLTATVSGNLATVQAAIHDEQTARADATTALTQTISELTAQIGANSAAISNEQTARTTANDATAQTIQTLQTTFNGNLAQVNSAQTAQSTATNALSSKVDALTSQVGTNTAAITTAQKAQSDAASAQASLISQLQTQVGANSSAVQTETQARTDAVSGLATQITALTTQVGNNASAITSEQTARASLSDSLAQSITQLKASVANSSSLIDLEYTTRANADNVLTQSVSDLSATVGANKADYTSQISTLSDNVSANATAITGLQASVGTNTASVQSLQQALSDASSSMASQTVNLLAQAGRQRVFFQNVPPNGNTDAVWYNTADGNKPYMWDGQEWVPAQDAGIASIAATIQQEISARASDNQATANQLTNLTSAINNSISAYQQSNNTSSSNDQATANAVTLLTASVGQNSSAISNEANTRATADTALSQQISTVGVSANRQRVFFQSTAPVGVADAVWFNSSDGNKPYGWNGTAWVPRQDAGIGLVASAVTSEQNARQTQDTALANSISALTATVNGNTANISQLNQTEATNYSAVTTQLNSLTSQVANNLGAVTSEAQIRATQDQVLSNSISTVSASANRQRVFFQSTAPTGQTDAVWFNTSDGNKPYSWTGTVWAPAQDAGIATVAAAVTAEQTARTTADTAQAQQISGLLSSVQGNTATITINAQTAATATSAVASQVSALQTTVGQNTLAITNEASLRSTADTNLASQISTVSASANRQRVFTQSTAPTGSSDALWINTSDGNKLYSWNGTAWVPMQDTAISTVAAAVSSEQTARTTADTALSGRIDTVVSTVAGNTALIQSNAQTAATATSAVATNLAALQVTVGQNSGAITTEQQARATGDSNLLAQINTVSSSANRQRVFFQSTAPTGQTDAVWFNTGAGNTPYYWNGSSWIPAPDAGIAGVAAAVSTESSTRLTNDTALGQQIQSVLAVANGATSAITTETTARVSGDSALNTLITNLTTTVQGNVAAITAEANTRANADSAEASQRTQLSASLSATLTNPKTWVQATAPSLAQMFPPGRNYHPDCLPGVADLNLFTYSIPSGSGYSRSIQTANGVGVFAFSLTGTLSSSQYFDTYCKPAIIGGQNYEFSAYMATTNCTGQLFIQFSDSSGNVLAIAYSGANGQGAEYNGGTIASGAYSASSLGRIWVHGTAPASATTAILILRGAGIGAANPSLIANHFYFGILPLGQTSPTDWQQAAIDQIWVNTGSNNQLNTWDATSSSWVVKSDQRIDASISAIANEATTRANADGVLTTQYNSVLALSQSNAAAITSESTARSNADSALSQQISQVSATAASQKVFNQNSAPTGAYGAVWYNTANNNIPYLWNGSAWVPAQDQTIPSLAANITTEQQARIAGDSTLTTQYNQLSSNLGLANAAITNEANTRATADTVQANARQSLAAGVNTKTTWAQSSAPSVYDMFPAGVNMMPNSVPNSVTGFTASASDGGSVGINIDGTGRSLAGGHTIYNILPDSRYASGLYMDLSFVLPNTVTAGNSYEISAYIGCQHCTGFIYIGFLNASGTAISYFRSDDPAHGGTFNGGSVAADAFAATSSLNTYQRLWAYATAPTGAVSLQIIMRGYLTQGNASVFATRLYAGLMTANQSAPADWSIGPVPNWINTANSNIAYTWSGFSGQFAQTSDSRTDTNIAAIATEQNVRLAADNSLASQITTLTGQYNGNTALINNEATTRANNDTSLGQQITSTAAQTLGQAQALVTAEQTARQNQDGVLASSITNLGATLNGNITTAVGNESQARATADGVEASTRASQIAAANASGSATKFWVQSAAPTPYDMFPASTNILPDAVPLSGSQFSAINTSFAGMDIQSGAYQYPGGHTAAFFYNGTLASGATADTVLGYSNVVVSGFNYEFSAYLGAHRTNAILILQFGGANGVTATYLSSTNGQGAEYSVNNGTLPANTYFANSGVSSYGRLQVYGTAPSGSTNVTLYFRMQGYGDNGPYLFIARPYFGRSQNNQNYAADWKPSQANQTWINTSDNNSIYTWTGQTWTKTSDQRIDSNIAAIQNEANTRLTNDSSLTSQINTAISNFNGNLSSVQNQINTLSNSQGSTASQVSSLTASFANGNGSANLVPNSDMNGIDNYPVPGATQAGYQYGVVALANSTGRYYSYLPAGSGYSDFRTPTITCVAGSIYEFSVAAENDNGGGCALYFEWINASGSVILYNQIGGVNYSNVIGTNGIPTYRMGGFATAPSGAVTVDVIMRHVAYSGNSTYVNYAQPMLRVASPNQTSLSPYQPGPPINLAAIKSSVKVVSDAQNTTATALQQLTSTVNGNTINIGTQQQTINGLSAKYTIGVTANGQTGGLTLAGIVQPDGTLNTSLTINANVTINGSLLVANSMDYSKITAGQVQKIASNSTIYVDSTYGNDSFGYGIGGYNLPFKTVTACINYIATNLAVAAGITIQLRTAGTYDIPEFLPYLGCTLSIVGDQNNQQNYIITRPSNQTQGALFFSGIYRLNFTGVTLQNPNISNGQGGVSTVVAVGGTISLTYVTCSVASGATMGTGAVMQANSGGYIGINDGCIFSGNAPQGTWGFANGGQIGMGNANNTNRIVTFQGTPQYAYTFVLSPQSAVVLLPGLSFSGSVTASQYAIGYFAVLTSSGKTIPGQTGNSYNNGKLL